MIVVASWDDMSLVKEIGRRTLRLVRGGSCDLRPLIVEFAFTIEENRALKLRLE